MYKDRELQKEANRLAAQRRRDKGMTRSNTLKDSNPQNVIPDNKETSYPDVIPWYPNKQTNSKGKAITPVTLSDGQLWYPASRKAAKKDVKAFGILPSLVDKVRRDKLERITASLKSHSQLDGVRYGVSGPTFTQVSEMLEVTAS